MHFLKMKNVEQNLKKR